MRRARNPEATKTAIMQACVSCLAAGGAEGVSLSEVAALAGVNRSTVYDYYETRERLIQETVAWISDRLFDEIFGGSNTRSERPFEHVDVLALNERLAKFGMENTELCQVWLMQVLAMADPGSDKFWQEYEGALERFARTEAAQPGADAEVFTVILLASAFIWPVLARTRARTSKARHDATRRYLHEWHRLALYGIAQPASFPQIVRSVAAGRQRKPNG